MTMNIKKGGNQLESWFSLLPVGIVVIMTIMIIKKMDITFTGLRFPYTTDPPIQSVSFTSSENKCAKQRRINTVDFILERCYGRRFCEFLLKGGTEYNRSSCFNTRFPLQTGQLLMPCTWNAM